MLMTTGDAATEWCQVFGVDPAVAGRPKAPWLKWKRVTLEGILTSGKLSSAHA